MARVARLNAPSELFMPLICVCVAELPLAWLPCDPGQLRLFSAHSFFGLSQSSFPAVFPATEYSAPGALRVRWKASSVSPRMAA